jgi:hypothetical protein
LGSWREQIPFWIATGLQENLRKPRKVLGIDVRSTKKEIFNRKQASVAKAAKNVGMVLNPRRFVVFL